MGSERMGETIKIREVKNSSEKKQTARIILEGLPEWFGIPEAREEYVNQSSLLPMIGAFFNQQPIGFLSIKQHFTQTAEYYVLGVKREFHRKGVGTRMSQYAEKWAIQKGFQYFQVKTLSADHPDPFYYKTRLFYEHLGFVPLEVFPMLWGVENPCLLMIKRIGG